MKRRDFVKKAGIGSAALVSLPALAQALTRPASPLSPLKKSGPPPDTFVILLHGFYKPAKRCPDLGLSGVDLCDGSYSTTKIISAPELVPEDGSEHDHRRGDGERNEQKALGDFYVQFDIVPGQPQLAVYDLREGNLKMVFTGDHYTNVPDGEGGTLFLGTNELTITDATGVYQSFIGGHNTMVDILHQLANGSFFEHCYCFISRP